MNNLQKRKLRKRLMAVVVSICACVAVMAVGVYAATTNFSIQVSNEVDINLSLVAGKLSAKRGGDVIYGTVSMGDDGVDSAGNGPESAEVDYLVIYDNFDSDNDGSKDGYSYVYDRVNKQYNKDEIQKKVNFYLSAKDSSGNKKKELTIFYVFKFEFVEESASDVIITVSNSSTQLSDTRKDYVSMTFKYLQGPSGLEEPTDWTSVGTSLGIDNFPTSQTSKEETIRVFRDNFDTHVVYIYASMTVQRTDTLESAYSLGVDGEEFYWAFGLSLEPVA